MEEGSEIVESAGDRLPIDRDDSIDDSDEEMPIELLVSTEGDGGVGNSIPSKSPSSTISSSSVDGKKLRKRSSACHFDAFLNSTQTSIRPGRDNAGSKRSR